MATDGEKTKKTKRGVELDSPIRLGDVSARVDPLDTETFLRLRTLVASMHRPLADDLFEDDRDPEEVAFAKQQCETLRVELALFEAEVGGRTVLAGGEIEQLLVVQLRRAGKKLRTASRHHPRAESGPSSALRWLAFCPEHGCTDCIGEALDDLRALHGDLVQEQFLPWKKVLRQLPDCTAEAIGRKAVEMKLHLRGETDGFSKTTVGDLLRSLRKRGLAVMFGKSTASKWRRTPDGDKEVQRG